MKITINIEETRELSIEPLEAYLIRTDWEHQGGHVWYKPHYHVIFAENLQHAINTLATDEKRSSGAVYEDILTSYPVFRPRRMPRVAAELNGQ